MENLNLNNTGTLKLKEHKTNTEYNINMLDICTENCESDVNVYNIESDLESEIEKCNEILNPKSKTQFTLEDSCSVAVRNTYETDKLNSEIDQTLVFLVPASSSKNIGETCENINNEDQALVEDKLSNNSILFHPSKLQNGVFLIRDKIVDTQIQTEEIKMDTKLDTFESNIENELSHRSKKIKLDPEGPSLSDTFVSHETSEYITDTVDCKQEKISKRELNFEESTSLNSSQNEVSASLEVSGSDDVLNCPLSFQQIDSENNKNCLKNVLSEKISSKDIFGENEFVTELISNKTEEFKSEELFTNGVFKKRELLLGWMKDTDSTESDWKIESVSIPKTCERHYSGDTLILDCEESDIDSEIDKCNELLNQSVSCKNVEIEEKTNFESTDHVYGSQNLKFLKCDLKTISNEGDVKNLNLRNKNSSTIESESKEILLPATETDSAVKTQPDSDINYKDSKTEIEDSNKLHNSAKVRESKLTGIKGDSNCHKQDNSINIKQNVDKNEEPQLSSESDKISPKRIEISEKSAVTSNVRSPKVKECQVTKKGIKSKTTPERNHPERIFSLAVKAVNNENNTNSNTCPDSAKTGNQNNSLNSTKNIDHEKGKKTVRNTVVKDYFEEEKDDILNPEWQVIKNLSSKEEHYRQVRSCWKSRSVPDPNKNLTYHSYRKRLFGAGYPEVPRDIRQHKRHASSTLSGRSAKRLCTFFLDKEIDSVKKTKDMKKQEIINEMHSKISSVDEQYFQRENSFLGRSHYNTRGYDYYDRHDQFNNRVAVISEEYNRIVDSELHSIRNKIDTLNERRNEVLKFYSFYKGLNDSNEDPTLLTESQFLELDEIESVYRQFDHYYAN